MLNCLSKKTDPTTKPQQYILKNGKYKEECLIAEGGYAYIWKCQQYAIKRIFIQSTEIHQMALREISVMKNLPHHPNLITMIDYGEVKLQNKMFICIVMELCETTLYTMLQQNILSERKIIELFLQIVDGVEVLHADSLNHRDLKLENVLIQRGICKLCDFGSSSKEAIDLSKLTNNELMQKDELFSQTTTITYRPPEMIDVLSRQIVDSKADIWQLGCILYCMCFRKSPFQDMNKISIAQALFEIPQSQISIKTVTLIQKMLQQDSRKRPTIKEIKLTLYETDQDEWGEFQ